LTELQHRDENGVEPFGSAFDGHEKVVPVHDGMDAVIHHNEEESAGRGGDVGMPAVEKDGDVMIPMKKNEGLFVNDDEECVEQFGEFAEDKELDPESGGSGSVERRGVVAQVIAEGVVSQIVEELGSRSDGADPGKETETQVPEGEKTSPAPRRSTLHVSLTPEDQDDVGDACPNGDHGTVLHPCQCGDGIVEPFKREVGERQSRVEAREFSVFYAEAVRANAFCGDVS